MNRGRIARSAGAAVLGALVCAVAAAGAPAHSTIVFTLAQARGLMAQYHPGGMLPAKVPPSVRFVDVGGGCSSLGVGGPPCFARLEFVTRRTGGRSAFQLAVFNGRVKAKVVRALLRHDGKFGSTRAFKAGRYAGTRERQWNRAYRIGGVDAYVWQYKRFTYALLTRFLDNGAQAFRGLVPARVIASFVPARGAPVTPPPPTLATMPNVVGMTFEAATESVAAAGLEIRRIGQEPAPTPELVDKVVRSDPRAGAKVSRDTIVTVWIGTAAP